MSRPSCRILLVEDEFLVSFMIENMLADLGHQLTAVADRVEEALQTAINGIFDLALLDLTLAGTTTYPVAEMLRRRGIPFAFLTGHDPGDVETDYAGVPILQKPFRRDGLAGIISRLVTECRLSAD